MKIEQAVDILQELQEPFCNIETKGVTEACRVGANAAGVLYDALEYVRIYMSDDGTEETVSKRLDDAQNALMDEIYWQTKVYNGARTENDEEHAQAVWEKIKNLYTAMACVEAVINGNNLCRDREADSKCCVVLDWTCCKKREGMK